MNNYAHRIITHSALIQCNIKKKENDNNNNDNTMFHQAMTLYYYCSSTDYNNALCKTESHPLADIIVEYDTKAKSTCPDKYSVCFLAADNSHRVLVLYSESY